MNFPDSKVYLIGQNTMNREAVRTWLNDLGAEEYDLQSEDAIRDPEHLIGLAAKRCYKSYLPGLNPNVTKVRQEWSSYFENILKVGHGSVTEHANYTFAFENVTRVFCYHPDTEIMTRSGWKPVAEVQAGETILTLNPATGRPRWSKNHQTHAFEYCGPLFYWQNREDQGPKVTPDHTMWCCPVNLRAARGKTAKQAMQSMGRKVRFRDLLGKPFFVQNAIGQIEGCDDSESITIGSHTYNAELLFEWLGLVATDGNIVKPETGRSRVRVNQTKPHVVSRIRVLGDALFGNRMKETGDHYKAFDVSCPDLYQWCVSHIGRTNVERTFVPLFDYSPRLVSSFLTGAFLGDGCHGSFDHRDISCGSNERMAKDYQTLIAISGRGSRVSVRTDGVGQSHQMPSGQTITATQPAVCISEHQRGEGACVVKAKHQRIVNHAGMVYCPRTDDGVVYVRAGGKSLWCGNTAEMNRHRAGVAISEQSLRYVRFEDLPFWMPPSLRPQTSREQEVEANPNGPSNPAFWDHYFPDKNIEYKRSHTRYLLRQTLKNIEATYTELVKIWDIDNMKDFAQKKAVTSMLRRIIPMGVCTGAVYTLNGRAIRHILTMRCAPEAEEEMVHVFSMVGKIMVESAPHLMQDFQQIDGFWVPKFKKV